MMILTPSQLGALEASATAVAAYLDACDDDARLAALDPQQYQTCGRLLAQIFTLVDARKAFPTLVRQSPAAREQAESNDIGRHLSAHRTGRYPELVALLRRVSA